MYIKSYPNFVLIKKYNIFETNIPKQLTQYLVSRSLITLKSIKLNPICLRKGENQYLLVTTYLVFFEH